MKSTRNYIILFIIDIFLILLWVLCYKPSSDISIVLIYLPFALLILNIICAILLFLFKSSLSKLFVVNAFIMPLILIVFFIGYIKIDKKIHWNSWNFQENDIDYSITYDNNKTYFVSKSCGIGCNISFDRGNIIEQNDTIFFISEIGLNRYFIHKSYLYNFNDVEKIKIKKQY